MRHTKEDLMALWRSVVDDEYARPLLENADSGIETIEQVAEQFARASLSIEQNRQEFFVRHWSGEEFPPAAGEALATVELVVTRDQNVDLPIVFDARRVVFEELEADYGEGGGQLYPTQRRYVSEQVTFLPGDLQRTFVATAERPGAGYNIPPPGSIVGIRDVAVGSIGENATIIPGTGQHQLVFGRGDEIPPSAVGQYLEIFSGANAGTVWRIVGYSPATLSQQSGGVYVAATGLLRISSLTGTFIPGEAIEQGTATGTVLAGNAIALAFNLTAGTFAAGLVTGVLSGATALVDAVEVNPQILPEVQGASWILLGWGELGLGFSATNPSSPSGGKTATLDHIGGERLVGRTPGEADEPYRERVVQLPDTVSPNALLRAANRILAPYGVEACLREPGEIDLFPGFFLDTPDLSGPHAYAYDMTRVEDRYKVMLSYTEMRAWVFILLPRVGLGEFGFGYDDGGTPFFDSAPALSFLDGFPITQSVLYLAVWNAVNEVRAAGVGVTLLPDQYGCGV